MAPRESLRINNEREPQIDMTNSIVAAGQFSPRQGLAEEVKTLQAELDRRLAACGEEKDLQALKQKALQGNDVAFAQLQSIQALEARIKKLHDHVSEASVAAPDIQGVIIGDDGPEEPQIVHL